MSRIRIATAGEKSAIVENTLVQSTEHIRSETWMAASDIAISHKDTCLRKLKLLVDERDDRGASVDVSDRSSYLAEFLAVCAHSLITEPGPGPERGSDEFYQARDVFVRAGLEALAAQRWQTSNNWLQIGIHPREDLVPHGDLCRQIACLARRLLIDSAIDNFFFMNKPPGMRLRFQTAAGRSSEDLADVLHGEVTRWREEGLIDCVEHGVYEPEGQLFGGPRSMSFVHALFTVDSLIWLDYHACRAVESEAISPAWLVSLAVLRTVFAGLDITGWEDAGVWDCIRKMAGRRFEEEQVSVPVYAEVAHEIRDVWSRRDQIGDLLHAAVKPIVASHSSVLLTGAAQWHSGYFSQPRATLGSRAAAAFYVIFHWNRAALSFTQQALLVESLSERIVDVRT
ncbi:MAG TPA: thiopeptide-type bacteriocin biosynthesis protein [Pyrinomonadaceae bacterium]|nr:thiopeptide-type bacteriocin biosynthesis protein [Pyrinomonadaceae bacterium]